MRYAALRPLAWGILLVPLWLLGLFHAPERSVVVVLDWPGDVPPENALALLDGAEAHAAVAVGGEGPPGPQRRPATPPSAAGHSDARPRDLDAVPEVPHTPPEVVAAPPPAPVAAPGVSQCPLRRFAECEAQWVRGGRNSDRFILVAVGGGGMTK